MSRKSVVAELGFQVQLKSDLLNRTFWGIEAAWSHDVVPLQKSSSSYGTKIACKGVKVYFPLKHGTLHTVRSERTRAAACPTLKGSCRMSLGKKQRWNTQGSQEMSRDLFFRSKLTCKEYVWHTYGILVVYLTTVLVKWKHLMREVNCGSLKC